MKAALALTALVAPASAQGIAYQWPDAWAQWSVASAGDVDGDGKADFAIGFQVSPSVLGRVDVRSASYGGLLWSAAGANPKDGFGSALEGLGDVDGDGSDDVAASAPSLPPWGIGPTPYVRVLSGVDGATLWEAAAPSTLTEFGRSLARISDLDGDGADDLIIGSSNLTPDATQVRSGASGALLFAVPPPAGARIQFGMCVDALGDLDGDGVEDFGVGDPSFGVTLGGYARGRITLHSGVDGSLLGSISAPAQAPAPWGPLGSIFDGLGDLDSDGMPEVAVGAPSYGLSGLPRGMVWVMSCADGSVLHEIAPEAGSNLVSFGSGVARTDDVDGDGVADLRVAAGSYQWGGGDVVHTTPAELRTYSGATGTLLKSWGGMSTSVLAPVQDVNGDARPDVLMVQHTGAVLALDGWMGPIPTLDCMGQAASNGCTPWITTLGTPSLTQFGDLELHVTGLPIGSVGLCIYGPDPATTPFGNSVLCIAPPFERTPLQTTTTVPDLDYPCAGATTGGTVATFASTLSKPDLAALGLPPGDSFFVQAWFRDPGLPPPNDFGLSGSLMVQVWP